MALYVGGTSLLLHGNGADGSTVFTDETGKTVTAYGNARISTAQSKFGGSSMYFDGVGDYLTVPSTDALLGTGDFCIEAWIFPPSLPAGGTVKMVFHWLNVNGINLELRSDGAVGLFLFPSTQYAAGGSVTPNQWSHIALCRYGNAFIVFVNGLVSIILIETVAFQLATLEIGYEVLNPSRAWYGYMDCVRVLKGVTPYISNFVPPTSQLGLISPVSALIQAQDIGLTKLAKYDPSQVKPVISEVTQDLQDRWPYGPYKTPAVQFEFKGRGRVTGTVAEKSLPANTPLRRLVRLHREPDGAFVRATWSDATTGAYTFNGVRPDRKYFVTSFDYTNTYRAVIADNLVPTPL